MSNGIIERVKKAQGVMEAACDKLGRGINIMEVCGTHTVSIFRNGIRSALPEGIKLLSGPGCPVCVTDQGYIDSVLELAGRDDFIVATYGDMIRVPGNGGSLESCGGSENVRVVLSSEDALELAKKNSEKQVVFVAVGFETTAPGTAVVVKEAYEDGAQNFSILSGHKLAVPAMRAILSGKNDKIDAFLCPGHVAAITGWEAFGVIAEEFGRPCVVAGFEALGILEALAEICRQLAEGEAEVKSMYSAVVSEGGNVVAQKIMEECFDIGDGWWRGLGKIDGSVLKLKEKYSGFDAFKKFGIEEIAGKDISGCQCGRVLCGLIEPSECGLFGKKCRPETPVGPCMVSSEGACSAWYKYGGR